MSTPVKRNLDSLTIKVLVLLGLLMASTLPRFYVDQVIADRQEHEQQAVNSVVAGWAARHNFGAMKMKVPYHYFVEVNSKTHKMDKVEETLTLSPTVQSIQIHDTTEIRHRGIFRIPIYKADLTMAGAFVIPSKLDANARENEVSVDQQTILILTKQTAAISEFAFTVGGEKMPLKRTSEGFALTLKNKAFKPGERVEFKFQAQLNGYQGLDIQADTDELEVKIDSSWPHPSFKGQLPIEQNIASSGYSARWKLIQPTSDQVISVDYIEPVNNYSQANRALKYGLLTTLLVLAALFMMETISGVKIHAMQYLLMTLPLSAFYMLLVALSEHIGFLPAYAIASLAVVGLIYFYFRGIGAPRKEAWMLTGLLSVIYGMISAMLSSEDNSLLIGSVSLFACLAAFMLLTRKLDWSKGIAQTHEA